MKLSKRLELVVSFAERPKGRGEPGTENGEDGWYRVADAGTDHGYVPIALAQRDQAVKAVAMDVRPGPLERARIHIEEYGLKERIETRLGDGVEKLSPGEADTVVIAGMGGELVLHILEGGHHLWESVDRWILSPQSEPDKVRRYLEIHGFAITREAMVEEEGRYYTVMEAVRAEQGKAGEESGKDQADQDLVQAGYLYGRILIEEKNPVLAKFLKREERQLKEILAGMEGRKGSKTAARQRELRQKLSWVMRARKEMAVNIEDTERREK